MTPITVLLKRRKHRQPESHSSTAGFTMIELIVVVVIVGILAAMASAGYLGWMARMRVNKAQDVALQAIRQAQSTAKQRNSIWQASFRQDGDKVQWAVHPKDAVPTDEALWNTINEPDIQVLDGTSPDYTRLNGTGTATDPWRVLFDHKGNVEQGNPPITLPASITLSNKNGSNKRCVIVKTLLGAVSTASDGDCN